MRTWPREPKDAQVDTVGHKADLIAVRTEGGLAAGDLFRPVGDQGLVESSLDILRAKTCGG